jgi:hypothetical protein
VFARWLPVGNLREEALQDVVAGPALAAVTAQLKEAFAPGELPRVPQMCDPRCGPSCSPACRPRGGCVPNYG